MPKGIPNVKRHIPAVFVAKDSFTTVFNGTLISVSRGVTTVREGHPLLLGRESLFEPQRVDYEWDPEPVVVEAEPEVVASTKSL